MPKQTVPDIQFDYFVLAEIPKHFANSKILINSEYQRGNIWKPKQKIALIESIITSYSIGVLVLFKNDADQFEILDGQQRLLAIQDYLDDRLDLTNSDLTQFKDLSFAEKTRLNAYCVFYLKLKSYDPDSKEEDIFQTFLRLQEGTPLNKAEKINAYRGEFKNFFRTTRESHPTFKLMEPDKRFRLRQLAAELLLLELEGDFENMVFPDLDLESMITGIKKYAKSISTTKKRFFTGNLDLLYKSLNYLLTGFNARELISFYLLTSYLRRKKAGNDNLINELAVFATDFLKNLNLFSVYDTEAPDGMTVDQFNSYRNYKFEAKIMTTGKSIKQRLEFILAEFKRMHPFIEKDGERLHDVEQKRTLYFRQKGLCGHCGKPMEFKTASSHHVIAHAAGGITADLNKAQLLHDRCHMKVEKRKQSQIPIFTINT